MRIAVPREVRLAEHRVALVPETVARLVSAGHEVWVETGAGEGALYDDATYRDVGAMIGTDVCQLWGTADVVLKVGPPAARQKQNEVDLLREGAVLIGLLNPLVELSLMQRLAARKITAFSLELIPRLSRAQSMDVLSSQATIAGYKAVVMAAGALGKFFPMLTTAAGTTAPSKVFILGAGVAGLTAIATARRLGAIVEVFDIRPAVREEVQSLGATFVGVELAEATETSGGYARDVSEAARQREREVICRHIAAADVVITTAQVPGKHAPLLVTEAMVASMQPGSVIVDLAAEQGGNCACTEPGRDVMRHGVTILGRVNVPSLMPLPASQMYARNILAFLRHLFKDGVLQLDFADEITAGACVTHGGAVRHPAVLQALDKSVSSSP